MKKSNIKNEVKAWFKSQGFIENNNIMKKVIDSETKELRIVIFYNDRLNIIVGYEGMYESWIDKCLFYKDLYIDKENNLCKKEVIFENKSITKTTKTKGRLSCSLSGCGYFTS